MESRGRGQALFTVAGYGFGGVLGVLAGGAIASRWGFQVMFEDDGLQYIDGAGAAAVLWTFDYDTWINCVMVVDLDNDQSRIDMARLGAVNGILGQPSYIAFDLDSFSSWH